MYVLTWMDYSRTLFKRRYGVGPKYYWNNNRLLPKTKWFERNK